MVHPKAFRYEGRSNVTLNCSVVSTMHTSAQLTPPDKTKTLQQRREGIEMSPWMEQIEPD